ncbi:MAG: DUF4406 domain-containing protein [Burkholderiales bacterium]|nr:DUF4406 domain-containing protein [Burkholderiales bacterium]
MEISEITKQYWTKEDWENLEKVESAGDLYIIAQDVISRMPKPFVQVCGPIATGGLGSLDANLNLFNETIKELQNEGLSVFDQMPFEDSMQRLKKKITSKSEVVTTILTDFYYPIFESGLISAFYFIPGWETSFGAKCEHEKAKELGIKIVYL